MRTACCGLEPLAQRRPLSCHVFLATTRNSKNDQFAQATLLIRQPAAVLISVRSILILSVSPEGSVTVSVALLFLICGVLTVKFFSQPVSQSCAQMNMSASMRRISRGAFA